MYLFVTYNYTKQIKKKKEYIIRIISAVLILLVSSVCHKSYVPEPQIPPKEKSDANIVHEKSIDYAELKSAEGFVKKIDEAILKNGIEKSKCYIVFMNEDATMDLKLINFIKILDSLLINNYKVADKKTIKSLLSISKDIIILEISYSSEGDKILTETNAYSALLKKYLFSVNYEIDKGQQRGTIEGKAERKDALIDEVQSQIIAEVEDKILAIESHDINNDGKLDLILLTPKEIIYFIMAYDTVLEMKNISILELSDIKSMDPSAFIMMTNNYIFMINSNMKQGICLNKFNLDYCDLSDVNLFGDKVAYELVIGAGENWFKLNFAQGNEIIFHTMHYISDDEANIIYYLGLDNKIHGIKVNNNKEFFESSFKSGRAFSINNHYLITSFDDVKCPPDGLNIYIKGIDNTFVLKNKLNKEKGCITAIDLIKDKGNNIAYYYSIYDTDNKKSIIMLEKIPVE